MTRENDIDLDLIQQVQRARIEHDRTALPSQMTAVYWIEAKNEQPGAHRPTPRLCEWRIDTTAADADTLWRRIREATWQGALGYKSKVSTRAARTQHSVDQRQVVVMMYDRDDDAHIARVRQQLLDLDVREDLLSFDEG